MTDHPKVVTMNPAPDKMTEAIENLRRGLEGWSVHAGLVAQYRRKMYDAHIAEGFTPEQSLELVKKLW